MEQDATKKRNIYTFFVTSTDTKLMKVVTTSVIDTVLKRGLSDLGLL
jgi:hypothetical protein